MYEINYIFTKTTKKLIKENKINILEGCVPCAPYEFIKEDGHIVGIRAINIANDRYEQVSKYPEKIEITLLKLYKKNLPIPDFHAVDRDKDYLLIYKKAHGII